MLYINIHILQKDMKLKIPKKLVDLLSLTKDKIKFNIYFDSENQSIILKKVTEEQSQFFQDLSNDSDVLIKKQLSIESSLPQEKICNKVVKFVDLFAGLGGLRLGFEQAFHEKGFKTKCILTSEIKPYAIQALRENFQQDNLQGDITKITSSEIEDFDFLLAGFPCQSFSTAGKGLGFADTRGTLFFEIERILKAKSPYGFILENVEGLILHDREKKSDSIGRTLQTILYSLEKLGYNVQWKLLECQKFGVPQQRKRIFIVGTKKNIVSLEHFQEWSQVVGDILEHNQPVIHSHFTECLMKKYSIEKLYGKAIKDKRGGGK